jgi:GntR family transcriptional regulator, uxu operon transcriptional repressor
MRTISNDKVRDVAETILRDASRRGLSVGGQLPTERSLANELQLSRSTVRSAMALLESDGAISREVGRGTYLRFDPTVELAGLEIGSIGANTLLNDIGPADVMTARQLLEPSAMFSVVDEATEADFEEVDRCLEGCAGARDYDEFEQWDLAFHRSLIEATHNPLLVRMYGLIEIARQSDLWGSMKRRGDSDARRHGSYLEHRAILAALRSRNGRSARDAMAKHLDTVEAFLRVNSHS